MRYRHWILIIVALAFCVAAQAGGRPGRRRSTCLRVRAPEQHPPHDMHGPISEGGRRNH